MVFIACSKWQASDINCNFNEHFDKKARKANTSFVKHSSKYLEMMKSIAKIFGSKKLKRISFVLKLIDYDAFGAHTHKERPKFSFNTLQQFHSMTFEVSWNVFLSRSLDTWMHVMPYNENPKKNQIIGTLYLCNSIFNVIFCAHFSSFTQFQMNITTIHTTYAMHIKQAQDNKSNRLTLWIKSMHITSFSVAGKGQQIVRIWNVSYELYVNYYAHHVQCSNVLDAYTRRKWMSEI